LKTHRDRLNGGKKAGGLVKKSMPGSPLISIITVVHNAGDALVRTIDEVRKQTYPHKEHIIIDGGSTDGTLEILENDSDIDYWLSEVDQGIYDAMDKGIEAADGSWLYFLGVDDVFNSRDTLESIYGGRFMLEDTDLVLGNVYTQRGLFKGRFGGALYFKNTVHHQGVFYRSHVFDRFRYCRPLKSGHARRWYGISGDYRLNLMLFLQGASCIYVDKTIARCQGGISMQGQLRGYMEEIHIRHEQMGFCKAIFFDLFTLLRYLYKKIS